MFTWAKAILVGLQLIEALTTWLREKQQMDAGADREIAKITASILVKTQAGKEILARVSGMSDEEVDAALKELEPK